LVRYKLYVGKDERIRAYNTDTHKIVSWPRPIIEQLLGRSLEDFEQVHHIDGNFNNNDVSNLKVLPIGEHQKIHKPF
jgi:hypothetical protein